MPVGKVGNLDALARILCCKVGCLPMSYLGMPLGAHFKDASIWNPILERVEVDEGLYHYSSFLSVY